MKLDADMAADPPKAPPALDAIVDRVLAYNPKDGKTLTKRKRRADSGSIESKVLFSRRKKRSDA